MATEHWHDGDPVAGCRAACGLPLDAAAGQGPAPGVPCADCLAAVLAGPPARCPGCAPNFPA